MRVSIDERLARLCGDFSVARIGEWLERKFPSYDTSRAEVISIADNKNDREYFRSARLLGFVRELPDAAGAVAGKTHAAGAAAGKTHAAGAAAGITPNRPLLVAAVEMRKILTERTSRQAQFALAKRVLQNAVRGGAAGLNGYPSQGLFFFYDADGFFRISLVTGETEGRRFKFNEAKRQSFYIDPNRPNNVAKSRLSESLDTYAKLKAAFSVETLTREFYTRLFAWYEWALKPKTGVTFPNDDSTPDDDRKYNNESIIRLITRLMFTWFIRQRNLVRNELFSVDSLGGLLKKFDPQSMEDDNYYRCILQNLFFATFNCQPEKRGFIRHKSGSFACYSDQHNVKTLYRYEREFKDADTFKALVRETPFLNCALFDCLDRQERKEDGGRLLLFDGFSDNPKRRAHVPNGLFFHPEKGLLPLFETYEFTIDENNADDADVALDPELLGKVFENLLGAFNPETQETARKATGSFYTPREIVDYMVEESLKNYLKSKLAVQVGSDGRARAPREPQVDAWLADLFDKTAAAERRELPFDDTVAAQIREALYRCKILDPACGSGAFPMGILHCMVRLFGRLDPSNIDLNKRLIRRYRQESNEPRDPSYTEAEWRERQEQLKVQLAEGQHYPDYARKLYLIENCIYGVDIQPIATQISKLRFFISLLCDQLRDLGAEDGARRAPFLSLPNLEAKFVCANTLIALPRTEGELELMSSSKIPQLREKLQANRHRIFAARTFRQKEKLKRRDLEIRDEIRDAVRSTLAKPDRALIQVQEELIAKLRRDRKAYETPRMVRHRRAVQGDLFAPTQTELAFETVDANQPKREQIDAQIAFAQRKIDAERAKASAANVTKIDQLATLIAGWDPYDQNASSSFFDPEWMFNLKDGFDIVIGNPPYISAPDQLKDATLKAQRERLAHDSRFKCLVQKWDLYIAFMELSIRYLLNDGGSFAMIVPYPLTNQTYGAKLRQMLLKEYALTEIVDLDGEKIFENATVTNCIPFVEKRAPVNQTWIAKVDDSKVIAKRYSRTNDELMPDEKTLVWKTSNEQNLLTRFKGMHTLGDYCYISEGMKLNADEKLARGAFSKEDLVSTTRDRQHNAEYIEGKDIERYAVKRIQYLEYGTERCPGLLRRPTFEELYRNEKLVFNILGDVRSFYDKDGRFLHSTSLISAVRWITLSKVDNKSISSSVKKFSRYARKELESFSTDVDLRYVLGVMNSHLALVLLNNIRGGDYHIYAEYLRSVPIPRLESTEQKPIITLVDRILVAKKHDPYADTSAWEREIDQLVYKLYGLTEEEIAVVEGHGEGGARTLPADVVETAGQVESTTRARRRGRVAVPKASDDDEELE